MKDLNITEAEAKTLVNGIRLGLRFNFNGIRNIEELFTLTQGDLSTIFSELKRQRKNFGDEDSLLPVYNNPETSILDMRIEIVRIIYVLNQDDLTAARIEKEKQEKRAEVLELIARKRGQKLDDLPLEELEALYETI